MYGGRNSLGVSWGLGRQGKEGGEILEVSVSQRNLPSKEEVGYSFQVEKGPEKSPWFICAQPSLFLQTSWQPWCGCKSGCFGKVSIPDKELQKEKKRVEDTCYLHSWVEK